jgi:hypothetical protein
MDDVLRMINSTSGVEIDVLRMINSTSGVEIDEASADHIRFRGVVPLRTFEIARHGGGFHVERPRDFKQRTEAVSRRLTLGMKESRKIK